MTPINVGILVVGFHVLALVIVSFTSRPVSAFRLPRIRTLDSLARYPDCRLLCARSSCANTAEWLQ